MKYICMLTYFTVTTANALENENNHTVSLGNGQATRASTLGTERNNTAIITSNDLVTRSELPTYIIATEKILNYYIDHRFQVDMNVYYGLFLMKVFLNQYWNKPITGLPAPMLHRLFALMRKRDYLSKHLQRKVNADKRPGDQSNKKIYTLINDYALWVSKLKKLRTNAWDEPMPSDENIENLYTDWSVYSKEVMNIFNFKKTTLVPRLVARCLENISRNPKNNTEPSKNCTSTDECRYLIQSEVDFGYIATHKLMILQNAQYARGCYIYLKALDEELAKRYCQAMYAEAVYIAKHDVDNSFTDLHMEQMTLCGLEGHADFLKKPWIATILKIQDSSGCIKFNRGVKKAIELKNMSKDIVHKTNTIVQDGENEWEIVKVPELDLMENISCNAHTSGLAIGTLSLAIRYIFETTLPVVSDTKKAHQRKNLTVSSKPTHIPK